MGLVHSSAEGGASIPSELVARLEVASEGSRELDALIWPLNPNFKRQSGQHYTDETLEREWREIAAPRYTTSLDAALALAERVLGADWSFSAIRVSPAKSEAYVWPYRDHMRQSSASAPTPALALCVAVLKARTVAETGAVGTPKA